MRRFVCVLGFIVLLSVCYAEENKEASKAEESGGSRYILAFQSGFGYCGVSVVGNSEPIYTGVFGGNFMYLMPSGFTVSTDAEAIVGSIPLLGITGGLGLNLFLGYTWLFEQKHLLTVSGGVENSLTSKFISILCVGGRLTYIFKLTDKIGIMSSGTFGLSYNGISFGEGSGFGGVMVSRIGIRVGAAFEL